MRRFLIAVWPSLFAGLALLSLSAGAQTPPSKKDAADILEKAATAADLWSEDAPPYHLAASVVVYLGKDAYKGTYDLWWASPDKYREGFQMQVGADTYAETDLALGDKFYTLRNTTTLSFQLWQVRRGVREVHHRFFWGHEPKKPRVYRARVGGEQITCIDVDSEIQRIETCLDPVTGQVSSSSVKPTEAGTKTPEVAEMARSSGWEITNFAILENKRYPRRIKLQEYDLALEVNVTSLDRVSRFGDDVFQPIPRAAASDWCAQPTAGKDSLDMNSAPLFKFHAPGRYIAYYAKIASDGRASLLLPLRSGGSVIDGRMEDWLRHSQFGTLSCAGKPIEWEAVLTAPILVVP